MSKRKYTKELLEPLVKESTSIAQVVRKLGLKEAGGTHCHIKRRIEEYNLDYSHFLGQGANCGKNHKGGSKKKSWQEVLVKRKEGRRQHSFRLRRALIESGRRYICEECKQKPEWNGKELRLQVDHINRDWLDDSKENLRFICPNCHTQTMGFCGSKGYAELTTGGWWGREYIKRKNKKNGKPKKQKIVKKITDPNWRTKPKPNQRKVVRPDYETLKKELEETNYSAVGRKYGVSDNAIRKWIKQYEK